MQMSSWFNLYVDCLATLLRNCECQRDDGAALAMDEAVDAAASLVRAGVAEGGKAMVVGNGGSAGVSSHVAIDYSKNGRMPTLAFNDGAALTCMGNDFGYESVFSEQIRLHARSGDVLIAISSSGQSENILRATDAAREVGCKVITLSGFRADNPLRKRGDLNFYIDSMEYGFVEISHLTLCHSFLDWAMGWRPENADAR